MKKYFKKYLSYFGFIEFCKNSFHANSKIIVNKSASIIDHFSTSSIFFNQVFASLFIRKSIENECWNLNYKENKISFFDFYLLKFLRFIYNTYEILNFIFFGLKIRGYLIENFINKNKDKTVVVFEQKERNLDLKDKLDDYNFIFLKYSKLKTIDSKYVLNITFNDYLKIINYKIQNYQIKINFLIKYVQLIKSFNLIYSNLNSNHNYRFFSQEGFNYDHRLFINFFRNKNLKTYIYFNNLNYYFNGLRQLSDNIIVNSIISKDFLNSKDISKVIVLNDYHLSITNKKLRSSKIVKIGYFPSLIKPFNISHKQNLMFSFLNKIKELYNSSFHLNIREHPQVFKKNNNIKRYYNKIYSGIRYKIDIHELSINDYILSKNIIISEYYSTACEEALILGVPVIIFEDKDEKSMKIHKNFGNGLMKIIKHEKQINNKTIMDFINEKNVKERHKNFLNKNFELEKKISFNTAFS